MSDAPVTFLTQEAFDRLTAELQELSTTAREEIAMRIEKAREEGDLKENGGYHAAKDEQGKIELRIRTLTALLKDGKVGEAPESDAAHAAWAADIAQEIRTLAEQLREHVELLESEVNMSPQVLGGLTDAAEHLDEAAESLANHVTDYASAYEGVRETAEQHGGQIPGMDRSIRYWDETA